MKTLKTISIGFLCCLSFSSWAQQQVELKNSAQIKNTPIQFDFGGFIRHDAMFDTRQTVDVREAAVVLWGKDENRDPNGVDLNDATQFQMLGILSRAGVKISGPDVLGAKAKGYLEGDFFGNAEGGINEFRLRHAWVTLDWKTTQLGFGQYWHPLTIPELFPLTVNFSGGAPYMPYNRNPQIRLTQKLGKFNLMLAAVSQRDFTSNTEPYILASVPSGHLQVNFKTEKFTIGLAGHYEHIRPTLSSGDGNWYSNERLNSVTAMAYAKLKTKPVTIRAEATLAQNGASFVMLGGYAGYTLPGEIETYSTMNTQAYWIDIAANTKKVVPGLFVGYSQNDGATDPVETAGVSAQTYGLTSLVGGIGAGDGARTINHIYRIAPRVDFPVNNFMFRTEVEYSLAEWGDADLSGLATANKFDAVNWRFIFATVYKF